VETVGGSTSVEAADAMIESLSLETKVQDQPSTTKITMKSFQSNHLKNGDKRRQKKQMMKKKKLHLT
jgi:hypothetical protein